jgi:hypothetical protein
VVPSGVCFGTSFAGSTHLGPGWWAPLNGVRRRLAFSAPVRLAQSSGPAIVHSRFQEISMQTTQIQWNGSKRAGQAPDSVDVLEERLLTFTLDPRFERHGNFVRKIGRGRVRVHGNFHTLAAPFSIETSDRDLIRRLVTLIRDNQNTQLYRRARTALLGLAKDEVLEPRRRPTLPTLLARLGRALGGGAASTPVRVAVGD